MSAWVATSLLAPSAQNSWDGNIFPNTADDVATIVNYFITIRMSTAKHQIPDLESPDHTKLVLAQFRDFSKSHIP